jgi:hypothetical protein
MLTIGVLMSVYAEDAPDDFERAVFSILNQSVSSEAGIRLYLGVDGPVSPDMQRMIETFAPKIYHLQWFSENRGLVFVLNDLIHSRQDEAFFFRADSDDICIRTRFERQLSYMLENPAIDILGTDMLEVYDVTGERRRVHYASSPEEARQTIGMRVPVAHATVCIRARVFDLIKGYPTYRGNEDIAMWFACMKAGLRFDNIPEPLYECHVGGNFWKRRGVKKAWGELSIYIKGIWTLDGLSWRYLFPVARFMIRIAPSGLQRLLYRSRLRGVNAHHNS